MWSVWSQCSSECDSGVQTRERFCNSPSPQHEGSSCPGPHIQTRDCNSHPCLGTVSCFLIIQDPQGHGQICAKLCVALFKIQPYFSFLNHAHHSINVFMSNIQSWFSLLSSPLRRVSRGHGVHDSSRVWGSRRCLSTGVFGHDLRRGAVCYCLLRRLLLLPGLLPAQRQLCAPGTVPMLPPRAAVHSGWHPASRCLQ